MKKKWKIIAIIAIAVLSVIGGGRIWNVSAEGYLGDFTLHPKAASSPEAKKDAEEVQKRAQEIYDGPATNDDLMIKFPTEKIKQIEQKTGYKVQYDDYLPSRYYLEIQYNDKSFWQLDEMAKDSGHFFLMGLVNLIWNIIYTSTFQVINIIQDAFTLDIVSQFSKQVEKGIRNIAGWTEGGGFIGGIWGTLLPFMISLVGAWALVKAVAMKKTEVWTGLLSAIGVIVLCVGFFYNASFFLNTLNSFSSNLNNEVLATTLNVSSGNNKYSSEAAPYILSDRLYKQLIYEPYLILQHNGTSSTLPEDRQKSILQWGVNDPKRAEAVKEEIKKYNNYTLTTRATFDRLKTVTVLALTYLVVVVTYLLIAAGILFYQIGLLFLALIFPVVGILAIYPRFRYLLTNWFIKLVKYALMKFGLSFLLCLIFVMSDLTYQITPPDSGYYWTLFMQVIVVVGLWIKRKEIFGFLNDQAQVAEGYIRRSIQTGRFTVRRTSQTTISKGKALGRWVKKKIPSPPTPKGRNSQ